MAMAAIEAMSFGGAARGWKRPVLVSGLKLSRGGAIGFVRTRRRAVDEEEVSLLGSACFAVPSRDGVRGKFVVSFFANDGSWARHSSSGEREMRSDSEFEDNVLERQYREVDSAAYTPNSQDESTSRSGRRDFSTLCLFTLAALPSSWEIGEALAEDAPAKPQKKKGRAPSSPYDEDRLLEQNRRMQRLNNAPTEFPGFVREGFQVKVITTDKYVTSKSGLIYYDMVVGNGDLPQDGQQVVFHYTGYNESGRRVDSSYQQGRPARTRVGIQGMIPGFEEGIKSMRPGGRRIIIVPPELGPPVGPSTFFSAKQFEVFDVELLEAKDCSRRTLLFYSDVVCD